MSEWIISKQKSQKWSFKESSCYEPYETKFKIKKVSRQTFRLKYVPFNFELHFAL